MVMRMQIVLVSILFNVEILAVLAEILTLGGLNVCVDVSGRGI